MSITTLGPTQIDDRISIKIAVPTEEDIIRLRTINEAMLQDQNAIKQISQERVEEIIKLRTQLEFEKKWQRDCDAQLERIARGIRDERVLAPHLPIAGIALELSKQLKESDELAASIFEILDALLSQKPKLLYGNTYIGKGPSLTDILTAIRDRIIRQPTPDSPWKLDSLRTVIESKNCLGKWKAENERHERNRDTAEKLEAKLTEERKASIEEQEYVNDVWTAETKRRKECKSKPENRHRETIEEQRPKAINPETPLEEFNRMNNRPAEFTEDERRQIARLLIATKGQAGFDDSLLACSLIHETTADIAAAGCKTRIGVFPFLFSHADRGVIVGHCMRTNTYPCVSMPGEILYAGALDLRALDPKPASRIYGVEEIIANCRERVNEGEDAVAVVAFADKYIGRKLTTTEIWEIFRDAKPGEPVSSEPFGIPLTPE